jgi:tryptophan synthase alpha chain
MNNRITALFERKNNNLLSVFYTAGFPTLDSTIVIAKSLNDAGADIVEIGIPFSDPVADGPTIQESNKVALDNGMKLHLLIDQVKAIRKQKVEIPVILMGYLNPVMQYGIEKFLKDASEAGVDGLILPDLPLYVYQEDYHDLFKKYNLCHTFLISPTTSEERIRMIDAATNGFVYAVSASSTTGAKAAFKEDQISYFTRIKHMNLRNPLLIGFGISNHETFSKASEYGAGAIVGSAFINLLKSALDPEKEIFDFVNDLKGRQKNVAYK